jgi:hypothetical protein
MAVRRQALFGKEDSSSVTVQHERFMRFLCQMFAYAKAGEGHTCMQVGKRVITSWHVSTLTPCLRLAFTIIL